LYGAEAGPGGRQQEFLATSVPDSGGGFRFLCGGLIRIYRRFSSRSKWLNDMESQSNEPPLARGLSSDKRE